MLYNIDIDYGRENELIVFQKIKKFFDNSNLKELSYYDEFDYTNEDGTILCKRSEEHTSELQSRP